MFTDTFYNIQNTDQQEKGTRKPNAAATSSIKTSADEKTSTLTLPDVPLMNVPQFSLNRMY